MRYAPLPPISIDPRNEARLVQDASQKVYEASNQTLNDFSAGNPLAALLEGQAFAQGEFLYWANQLPQSILIEWLGPFLGAMRRLGTPATARLLVTVPFSNDVTVIPAGATFTTDPNVTGGEAFSFISSTELRMPAGESTAFLPVSSQYVGAQYNCAANAITGASAINVPGLSVTNPEPAAGGSDVETYQEVQERFFTLIRRRNPVSEEDWQNFFIDFYGVGTLTSVQPNRPNQGSYSYFTDYLNANGQVSFFVLGPNGTELTNDQLQRGQNVVNFTTPVEVSAHLYPMTLSQVQYDLKVEIDANGPYGSNLRSTALNFRDRLFDILTPGNVFPVSLNPTVSDVDAAFYNTFEDAVRYSDPHIEVTAAYNTPPLLEATAATYTQVYAFEPTEFLLNKNDLVKLTLPVDTFFPVVSSFTPYSGEKPQQTVYGNLELKQIKTLAAGTYIQGDVVYWDSTNGGDDELHVILTNLVIDTQTLIPSFIAQGRISAAMVYTPWTVGTNYINNTTGVFGPEIVLYDYAPDEFIPDPASLVPLSKRPGAFVWEVSQNFTLASSTNDLTGAQSAGLIGGTVTPQQLNVGQSYAAGTWVFTPQVGSGPNPVADPYYNYVDLTQGAVNKYAYVVTTFVYQPNELAISTYFDELVEQGIVKEIVVQSGDAGLPIYKYSPRFQACAYLEYRENSTSTPQYFIATTYFTPNSTNIEELLSEGVVLPLAPLPAQKALLSSDIASGTVKTPVRMFVFFKGDRTFFRQGSKVISYTATSSVTPLFAFYVYLQNGTFVETQTYLPGEFEYQKYVPYFDPLYVLHAENTVLSEDGRNLYRVMRAFTPPLTVVDWTSTEVVDTARIQEYAGNLLRYVNVYTCEQDILSQLGRDVSAIKLGIAQITLVPKDSGRYNNSRPEVVFVWENTGTLTEVPQLSYYSGTNYQYTPPKYRQGTLNL
jgi:hypothetical protein